MKSNGDDMSKEEIVKLMQTIIIHYPSAKNHFVDDGGRMSKAHVDEWHRCIGYLDYDDAVAKLDQYLKQPDGNKFAPDVKTFIKTVNDESNSRKVFHQKMNHEWYVDRWGHLYDEEGREYGDPICTAGYYLDNEQRVCQMGMVIHPHGTMLPEGPHKWDYIQERIAAQKARAKAESA